MDKEFENENEKKTDEQSVNLPHDISQIDIEDLIDNGVSDDMVTGATEEEKKQNRKKLIERVKSFESSD